MSTDLYEAAESLLAPEPTEDATEVAEEVNPVEDQAEDVDVSDDDQSEDEDVDPSDEDDVEASTDEEDDEDIAEDDDESEPDEAQTFPVVVDGQEEQWTLEQLKQAASGQGKIRKGFQEVAAARRELQNREAQLAQYEQQVIAAFQAAQSGANLTPPAPPSEDMLASDPIGYLEADVRYKKELAAYQANIQNMQIIQQQQQQRAINAERAFVDEQAKILSEAIPEYANPDTREALARSLIEVGQRYNFSVEELAGVKDARYVMALNDAKKYHDLMAKRETAQSKKKAPQQKQPIRAGAKKVADPANTARKKAQQRLQRTGSIDDAISLIFNS